MDLGYTGPQPCIVQIGKAIELSIFSTDFKFPYFRISVQKAQISLHAVFFLCFRGMVAGPFKR